MVVKSIVVIFLFDVFRIISSYYLFICSNQTLGALENFRKLTIFKFIIVVFFTSCIFVLELRK